MYLVLRHIQTVLDLGEIQNTGKVERIIHIQVNVEQRILQHGIKFMVELHVILLLQISRLSVPYRISIVDDLVLVSIHIFAVFPFLLLAESDRHRHETTVLLEQFLNFGCRGKLLGFIVEVKGYLRSTVRAAAFGHHKLRITFTLPSYRFGTIFPGQRFYNHLLRYHECRIETKTEMTYDVACDILIFLYKLTCTGKGYLVDILVYLFTGHTYAAVCNRKCVALFVTGHAHRKIPKFSLQFSGTCQSLDFLCSIHCICHYFPKENLVVRIQKLLYNGEYVLSSYPYFSFLLCHII